LFSSSSTTVKNMPVVVDEMGWNVIFRMKINFSKLYIILFLDKNILSGKTKNMVRDNKLEILRK
jgi:hypothetical protein